MYVANPNPNSLSSSSQSCVYIPTADATLLSKIAVMFGLLPAAASRAVEYADATCSYLVDPPVL
jgi:hypothetical protein